MREAISSLPRRTSQLLSLCPECCRAIAVGPLEQLSLAIPPGPDELASPGALGFTWVSGFVADLWWRTLSERHHWKQDYR